MSESTMLTIIDALAKALENEKMLREFYENRLKELEEKLAKMDVQKNG